MLVAAATPAAGGAATPVMKLARHHGAALTGRVARWRPGVRILVPIRDADTVLELRQGAARRDAHEPAAGAAGGDGAHGPIMTNEG